MKKEVIPKLFAYYLPQFHEVAENSKWWGKGFTEWTNLSKAKPLYKGHHQPDLPLNNFQYDLLDPDTLPWQVDLAKRHGVTGFNYYHYWFNGRQLLERPAQNFLKRSDVTHEFMFMWANHDWTRSWTGGRELLIKQDYGERADWLSHINYLMRFFEDPRYAKVDNMPVFEIYSSKHIPCRDAMFDVWRNECVKAGFSDLYLVEHLESTTERRDERNFKAVTYQEHTTSLNWDTAQASRLRRLLDRISTSSSYPHLLLGKGPQIYSYDAVVRISCELTRKASSSNVIPQVCTGWDNTPRYGRRGYVVEGATPEKFKMYLEEVLGAAVQNDAPLVFLACWNEWCEGLVLEPSERFGYQYLEAVRSVVNDFRCHIQANSLQSSQPLF